jgi:hypothetical protein
MEPRAIGDLAQLFDDRFFKEVATGLKLVFENASAMEADALRLIDQKAWRGARVLRAIADEEASKYLILLDAVRCPRSSNDEKRHSPAIWVLLISICPGHLRRVLLHTPT